MFQINNKLAVLIIMLLALVSGCVQTEKINSTTTSSKEAEVGITSIADSDIAKFPDTSNKEQQANSGETNIEGVPPGTKFPTIGSTPLPYSTPPITETVPSAESEPFVNDTPPSTVPAQLPSTSYACSELTSVQKQIQLLQNDKNIKNQMVVKYQVLNTNATKNGDTQAAATYQVQVDEYKKLISNIDIQLSALKTRESILYRECYR